MREANCTVSNIAVRSLPCGLAPLAALIVFMFMAAPVIAQVSQPSAMPTDSEIRNLLVERIDKQHQSVGIVVGVIDSSGRRIVSYGNLSAGDKRAVDGNTIFEIGSITKVFTSLLLADIGRAERIRKVIATTS